MLKYKIKKIILISVIKLTYFYFIALYTKFLKFYFLIILPKSKKPFNLKVFLF